jgi:flagellar biosynthesis protein FliR
VDSSLALLARLNSQLQLITLAFPIKMLLTLGLLAWLVLVFPQVLAQAAGPIFRLVRQLLLG